MSLLRIGTRTSALAMWQARQVEKLLNEKGVETKLVGISTSGDRSLGGDLSSEVGQFIHAVDKQLIDGEIDLAVHSSKDVPVNIDDSIDCLAYLERGSKNDVLLFANSDNGQTLQEVLSRQESVKIETALNFLPKGSTVGTVSGRRQSFLLSQRPDLIPLAVRGRVETRLKRLQEGRVDCIVLAEVGLQRLLDAGVLKPWMLNFGAVRLSHQQWPTAPGQGAISVHCLSKDKQKYSSVRSLLNHQATEEAVVHERAILSSVGGGCLYPAGIQVEEQSVTVKISPENWRTIFCQGRSFPTFHYDGNLTELQITLPEETSETSNDKTEGPKIVSTLNSDRLSLLLQSKGIPVVNQSVVTLSPNYSNWPSQFLDPNSNRSSWPYLVLTSPFAARCAVEISQNNEDIKRIQWMAIGEGTARACFRLGVTVSVCAQARNSKEFAKFIIDKIPKSTPLLLPRSDVAPSFLNDILTSEGYDVSVWTGYENQMKSVSTVDIDSEKDTLLLSSSSSARSWVENALPIPTNILCMGQSTKEHIETLPQFSQSVVEVLDGPTAEFISEWWNKRGEIDANTTEN